MEETNGQGAGCTAGAGREKRRERDVSYVWMAVGERDRSNRRRGAQDEEMEEREDFFFTGVEPTQQETER